MENKDMRTEFLQSIFDASIEVLGRSEAESLYLSTIGWIGDDIPVEQVLQQDVLTLLGNELSIKYHQNTAKGLMMRIGEAAFAFLRRRTGELRLLGSIDNRVKPPTERFQDSLYVLASKLSAGSDREIQAHKQGEDVFSLEVLHLADDNLDDDLNYYFFGGILRAFGYWLDSRKEYHIQIKDSAVSEGTPRVYLSIQPTAA